MSRRLAERFDAALERDLAAAPEVHAIVARVRSDAGMDYAGAAGDAPSQARPGSSLRIASVTKTFTAAATFRLVEAGVFGLDDPISSVLSDDTTALLPGGGYHPDVITVRQLLTHTAGLFDFTFGPGADYVSRVLADPQHRWTRTEQLELAMRGRPMGPPGGQYAYSDTAYSLLGEIIEQSTGTSLGAAMRLLLRFDELGIEHTYQESVEPVPVGTPARLHQWFGPNDTFEWDPSLDLYGGGGLVSTTADLATFYEALLGGRVFDRPGTLEAMLTVPPTNRAQSLPGDPAPNDAAAGIFRSRVVGEPCWGHRGFWGITVLRCDRIGLTVVLSISQASPPPGYTGEAFGAVLTDLVRRLA